jgi:hypothetical protein
MVLEESGETDLFGKLTQPELQQKDGGDPPALVASHPEVMPALVGHR